MLVLIAEDDPTTRMTLAKQVKQLGHRVLEAENGEVAKHLYDEHHPDAVFTDWMMPEVNGVDLCRYIRTHPQSKGTYVCMVTIRGGEWSRREGLEAGASDYLVKPVRQEDLEQKLRSVVDQRTVSRMR
jgi:two-component system phosphate regulon response regulator PhoB